MREFLGYINLRLWIYYHFFRIVFSDKMVEEAINEFESEYTTLYTILFGFFLTIWVIFFVFAIPISLLEAKCEGSMYPFINHLETYLKILASVIIGSYISLLIYILSDWENIVKNWQCPKRKRQLERYYEYHSPQSDDLFG